MHLNRVKNIKKLAHMIKENGWEEENSSVSIRNMQEGLERVHGPSRSHLGNGQCKNATSTHAHALGILSASHNLEKRR
ncbi:hypothetical protein QR98_0059390 [Sarcoptes scabiei]|uniref:Uncharacterized protein n=1 Tax=Sarcoptes scabiei TaxID=52283 RepID=A0A132AA29_SARSC|nr:hypothetical protein QR98_0059390 [Sarcoptes scabiei]